MMESKGGMNRKAAVTAGMKVAQSVAKRFHKFAKSEAAQQDILSAAYEAVLLAWESWVPERGPFEPHAAVYCAEYAKREANKSRSVVTTNYAAHKTRAITSDADVMVQSSEGEDDDIGFILAPETTVESHEQECEASSDLRALYNRWSGIMGGMNETQQGIAADIRDHLFNEEMTVPEIADKHGVSRTVVYRVREQMLHAARELF